MYRVSKFLSNVMQARLRDGRPPTSYTTESVTCSRGLAVLGAKPNPGTVSKFFISHYGRTPKANDRIARGQIWVNILQGKKKKGVMPMVLRTCIKRQTDRIDTTPRAMNDTCVQGIKF